MYGPVPTIISFVSRFCSKIRGNAWIKVVRFFSGATRPTCRTTSWPFSPHFVRMPWPEMSGRNRSGSTPVGITSAMFARGESAMISSRRARLGTTTPWVLRRKTQGVVVPSRAILDEIMALSPRANIADVIPTGVDPERFRPDISGQGIRTKWGLNGHDVVLHVGRVAPEKNLTTLIHAFPRILEQNRDTKLMIVGTGPYMEKYYDLVARLGLSGDVIFTGL